MALVWAHRDCVPTGCYRRKRRRSLAARVSALWVTPPCALAPVRAGRAWAGAQQCGEDRGRPRRRNKLAAGADARPRIAANLQINTAQSQSNMDVSYIHVDKR